MENKSEIVIYKSEDGSTLIDVKLQDETVWLTRKQMAKLFDRDTTTIDRHVNNIYKDGELQKIGSERKLQKTQFSSPPAFLYNLDMIISVGYRVNSKRGIEFRK